MVRHQNGSSSNALELNKYLIVPTSKRNISLSSFTFALSSFHVVRESPSPTTLNPRPPSPHPAAAPAAQASSALSLPLTLSNPWAPINNTHINNICSWAPSDHHCNLAQFSFRRPFNTHPLAPWSRSTCPGSQRMCRLRGHRACGGYRIGQVRQNCWLLIRSSCPCYRSCVILFAIDEAALAIPAPLFCLQFHVALPLVPHVAAQFRHVIAGAA